MSSFFLDMYLQLQIPCTSTNYLSEEHLESSRTSALELFCGNKESVKAVGDFRRKAPSWIFDRMLHGEIKQNSSTTWVIKPNMCN